MTELKIQYRFKNEEDWLHASGRLAVPHDVTCLSVQVGSFAEVQMCKSNSAQQGFWQLILQKSNPRLDAGNSTCRGFEF